MSNKNQRAEFHGIFDASCLICSQRQETCTNQSNIWTRYISFTWIINFSVEHRYIYNISDSLAIACGSPSLRYALNYNWKKDI